MNMLAFKPSTDPKRRRGLIVKTKTPKSGKVGNKESRKPKEVFHRKKNVVQRGPRGDTHLAEKEKK